MEKIESLEAFYQRKYDWIPDRIKNEIGHFNVFRHEPIEANNLKPLPYKRRDFYKIMLVIGDIDMHYADKVVSVKKQALFFSNPQIPYTCGNLERMTDGAYCIFNQHFFQAGGISTAAINHYSVFQPTGNHVFELTDDQTQQVSVVFKKMLEEMGSDYVHKYDVLRNLVFELLHFGMKMQAPTEFDKQQINASQRITTLFLELVERQFPIDENHLSIGLRSASDFANQLNVHVNHLNRAVKEITQKNTTQIIADRIMQEAKIMLRYSQWNVAEIAYALGFKEISHFTNFFKKHTQTTPSKFRKG